MGLRQRSAAFRPAVVAALPALGVIVVSGLLAVGGNPVREALRYARSDVASGEAWRIITGHLVHLGPGHFLLNAVGAVLIAALVAREFSPRDWGIISLASMAGISVGLWVFNPSLEWYVGLSGLLHAWLAAGVVGLALRRRTDALPLALLLLVKIGIEQWQGPLPGSEGASGGPVIVDAHLYGTVAGALAGAVLTRLGQRASL